MPRNVKRAKARNKGFASNSDVALSDFANSGVSKGQTRLKKGVTNMLASKVKEIVIAPPTATVEEKDWFEKDLDEFVVESDPEDEEEALYRGTRNRRRKKQDSTSVAADDSGIDYPIDIWFILGSYILPEEVATFSTICKSAYAVTQASKFWYRLYRRYYNETAIDNLPMRLQPDCMQRLYALKSCVVRSLYHFYPVFTERLKKKQDSQPDILVKRNCIMMWHQKGRMKFHYFFKLKESSSEDMHRPSVQPDLVEMLGDINANSEKGCKVLQVTTNSRSLIPPTILGHTLLATTFTLSGDLRSHCLRLVFGPSHAIHFVKKGKIAFSHIPEGTTGVAIGNVTSVRVLDWWNPSYPHSTTDLKPCANSVAPIEDIFF